jgi:endonuclease YncB( thermonuclease family)
VSRWLVINGHALDWPQYSSGAYSSEQAAAAALGRGLWQGDFVEPWTSRAERRN